MKIKKIFESETIGEENVMVSLNNRIFNGVIRANESATFILSCLNEDTTPQIVVSKLAEKYNISVELATKSVDKILSQLRDLNLLEE